MNENLHANPDEYLFARDSTKGHKHHQQQRAASKYEHRNCCETAERWARYARAQAQTSARRVSG